MGLLRIESKVLGASGLAESKGARHQEPSDEAAILVLCFFGFTLQ